MKPLGRPHLLGCALAALFLSPLAAATAPAAAALGPTPTCRGLDATVVGTPGDPLDGTDGDDVIVSNGASGVSALGGNDLVCVTGGSDRSDEPGIDDGAGDDVVDTTAFTGYRVETMLGLGSDLYVGRAGKDVVWATGQPGDHDVIRTGDGRDYVATVSDATWQVDVALGPLHDEVDIGPGVAFTVDGGHGSDTLIATGCDCSGAVVDLEAGTWTDELRLGDLGGFERVTVEAPHLSLYGTPDHDFLTGVGCGARVFGRAGGDYLRSDGGDAACAPARQRGGPGDDTLVGGDHRDLLYGGKGSDTAVGGLGHDLCRAEHKESCED